MPEPRNAREAVIAYAVRMGWESRLVNFNRRNLARTLRAIRRGRRARLRPCKGWRYLADLSGEVDRDAHGAASAREWTVLWNDEAA